MVRRLEISNSYFDIQKIANSGQLALIYEHPSWRSSYVCISELNYCIVHVHGGYSYIYCDDTDYWHNYFDLNNHYKKYGMVRDGFLKSVEQCARGIRILHRDLWEVIVSFILSQRQNIPNIRKMIYRLCQAKGKRLFGDLCSFPTAVDLADVTLDGFRQLGFGYRAEYIHNLVKICNAYSSYDAFKSAFYDVKQLMRINGVGPKVANCIDLYGLHNLEAFPIDVHIQRILDREYPNGFDMNLRDKGVYQMFMFYYELNKK